MNSSLLTRYAHVEYLLEVKIAQQFKWLSITYRTYCTRIVATKWVSEA
jgi:hypothetical protein